MTEDIITEDTNRKWLPLKTDIRKGSKNELCPDKGAELKVKILMYCPYIIKKTRGHGEKFNEIKDYYHNYIEQSYF